MEGIHLEVLESFLVHLERSIIAMAERSVIFKNRWVYLFIFDCAGSSWLHGFFPSCGERELPSSCSVQALHCGGFSCCRAWALGHVGFSSYGTWTLEHRPNSCDAQAGLLCGMWDIPGPGIETVYTALAGVFFITEPPAKPLFFVLKIVSATSSFWFHM